MVRSLDEIDPLALAWAPPRNETAAEKEARERREAEAKRISDEIDEQIRQEKNALRKRKKPIKVLLLGQSESGKSATLKNFQLKHARREWMEDRNAWRSVIQLNLIRMVNEILESINLEMPVQGAHLYPDSPTSEDDSEETTNPALRTADYPRSKHKFKFTEKHRLLRLRLGPLKSIEADLQRKLGAGATEIYATDIHNAAPFEEDGQLKSSKNGREFCVNSNNGWKSALGRFRSFVHQSSETTVVQQDADDDITGVIASLREDMISLWEDHTVKELLCRRKTRMEDAPGLWVINSTLLRVQI
jgi:hypothetical protein